MPRAKGFVQAVAEEDQPGAQSGPAYPPGEEVAYVIEKGTICRLEIDGKPAATKKAGEAFIIPPGTIHRREERGRRRGESPWDLHHR